ncbi:hypothetical protein EV715DRAFT_211073 [Schizophyllum commune]
MALARARVSFKARAGGYAPARRGPSGPHALDARVRQHISGAWAASTMRSSPSQVQCFLQYSAGEGVSIDMVLPASEVLLCGYVAALSGTMSGDAIRARLRHVHRWHLTEGAPWRGGKMLELALRAAKNAEPQTGRRQKREPITLDMLDALSTDLDLAKPVDAAIFCAATVAFHGQLRLGELLAPVMDIRRFNSARQPTGRDLHLLNARGSFTLHLPYTKVATVKGEEVAICRQDGPSDPIEATRNHCILNRIGEHTPLASYVHHGKRIALTSNTMLRRCNAIWQKRGLKRYTGHCFRIGGTTHFLLCGVNPDVVRALGRWSSSAFLKYWRSVSILATLHIERQCGGRGRTRAARRELRPCGFRRRAFRRA